MVRSRVLAATLLPALLTTCSGDAVPSLKFRLQDEATKPAACEAIWTARSLTYHPYPVTPRYMSEASCASAGDGVIDSIFTVINRKVGTRDDPNSDPAQPIKIDQTIGSVVKFSLDKGTGQWSKAEEILFEEALYIGGIVAAEDCSTIAFVMTRPHTDCGHDYTDVTSALAPCENADYDMVANSKGAWTGEAQQLKDLGWASPAGYCFEDHWKNEDNHGPNGRMPRWPKSLTLPHLPHMWLYEWKGAGASVSGAPSGKYIVSKMAPLDNWGQMALAFGENDGNLGTYAFSATTSCCCGSHVADSFMVINRASTHAAWSFDEARSTLWATGMGHTVNNRLAYNKVSKKYLRWITTDNFDSNVNGGCNNTEGQEFGSTWYGSLGKPLSKKGENYGQPWSNADKGCRNYAAGYVMIDGDTREQKDRYIYGFGMARQYMTKGTLSTLVPLADGGFLGVLNGEPNNYPKGGTKINNVEWYPKDPPTSIGLMRFTSTGVVVQADGSTCEMDQGAYGGDAMYHASGHGGYGTSKGNRCVKWVRCDPHHYLSYPILGALGGDRFLLGWSEMIPTEYLLTDFTGNAPRGENNRNWDPDQEYPIMFYMRVPQKFYITEINAAGEMQTEPEEITSIGWGEFNNMVPTGDGKVSWTYIEDPTVPRERPEPASELTAGKQKEVGPVCGNGEQPKKFQLLTYTKSATTTSVSGMCVSPANDGQPVCSRLSPPLRNATYGCGGPGGWEVATGQCSAEEVKRLDGGGTDDGSRGACGGRVGKVAGTASASCRSAVAVWPLLVASCLMVLFVPEVSLSK
eukprot:TRINITY_DN80148_c0_g1_i1.p1 TRINITY_DN80148_c0_g1~~TRINITY_DN80148_c0_g1_i1.p1  ORF type:complete len:802 (-),score=71.80 TRINITY_DN80148_c0_g1_i1:198-2603(-)